MKATDTIMSGSGACDRCGALLSLSELNTEAVIHHGQRELICKDRKQCERRRRKS